MSNDDLVGMVQGRYTPQDQLPPLGETQRIPAHLLGQTTQTKGLPTDPASRKDIPMVRGLLDYFPAALAAVAGVSKAGNDQHNPGEPLHWARDKSTDHADCIVRHLVDRGKFDTDHIRHSAKVAWRALALLQEELEAAGYEPGRGSWFPKKEDQ